MLTNFQVKNNNNTFNESYLLNNEGLVLSGYNLTQHGQAFVTLQPDCHMLYYFSTCVLLLEYWYSGTLP